ncbi:hypothetical protein ACN42_g5285 [Penicillium freii]|uniref:Uncharacterized protein n=1 Tax=Penicillium freii TaxID=48697 RepID=A0A101MJM7_PENFR|nr:hypothetical protein ACN42_g5285 [Penicillium freii]
MSGGKCTYMGPYLTAGLRRTKRRRQDTMENSSGRIGGFAFPGSPSHFFCKPPECGFSHGTVEPWPDPGDLAFYSLSLPFFFFFFF